jgi:hypothetical protein
MDFLGFKATLEIKAGTWMNPISENPYLTVFSYTQSNETINDGLGRGSVGIPTGTHAGTASLRSHGPRSGGRGRGSGPRSRPVARPALARSFQH